MSLAVNPSAVHGAARPGPLMLALVVLSMILLFCGGVFLADRISGINADLAALKDNRAELEQLERESASVEIGAWRLLAESDNRALGANVVLQAIALVVRTQSFYAERAKSADPVEAATSQRAVVLLQEVPRLLNAALNRGESGSNLLAAIREFPDFASQQEDIHAAWLEINRTQIVEHENGRDMWLLRALIALALVTTLMGLVAVALLGRDTRRRKEAIELLRRQATTDGLTGLVNQREFHSRLEAQITSSQATNDAMSLIVIDVDNFKRVNDQHGHLVGDQVLAEIAARIRAESRKEDCVGRVGGEEFAWIVPGLDQEAAMKLARRVGMAIRSTPFYPAGTLTISVGVAEAKGRVGPVTLYHLADAALFEAKDRGRDQVIAASTSAMLAESAELPALG